MFKAWPIGLRHMPRHARTKKLRSSGYASSGKRPSPALARLTSNQINRDRLRAQVGSSAEAEAIRQYCARLDELAAGCPDQDYAARIPAWEAWARLEADRVDPLGFPEQLGFEVPEEIRTYDLDKFMPAGMHAWSPPD